MIKIVIIDMNNNVFMIKVFKMFEFIKDFNLKKYLNLDKNKTKSVETK